MSARKAARRTVQLAVAALVAAVPALNANGWHHLSGNFFSFEAFGVPMSDPLAVVQALASARGVGGEATTGALLALGLAFLLGPVFCSWGCPFGLLSELASGMRKGARKPPRTGRSRPFMVRGAIAGLGLVLVALAGLPPLLNLLSMPGWWARLFQEPQTGLLYGAAVLPATALVIEALAGRRLWCRWVCPQAVLLALARRANPWALRVSRAPERCQCGSEAPCRQACWLGLDPRNTASLPLECTNCGDCLDACARRGRSLAFTFGPAQTQSPRQERPAGDNRG